jgi:membrane protease YdiL (CAAX protease family)
MPWDILLIFFVLGVVVPWRGRVRLKQLLAKPRVESQERVSLYLSTIAFQWIATAVAAWRAWAHGFTAAQLGVIVPGKFKIVTATIAGTAIIVTLQWLNLRRMGRSTSPLRQPLQTLAERILPQNSRELLPFLGLAVTAGLCEEFLYRGFAMAALARAGFSTVLAVVLSSVTFGLAHLYQGRSGFAGTTLLGLLLGGARTLFGSLIPVSAWHTGVDLVAGLAGPKYLLHNQQITRTSELP